MSRPSPARTRWGFPSSAWLMFFAAILTFAVSLWARQAMQPKLTPLEQLIAQNEPEDHAHGIGISTSGQLYVGSHVGVLTSKDQKRWQRLPGIGADIESIAISKTDQLYLAGPESGLILVVGTQVTKLLDGQIRAMALDASHPDRILAFKQGNGLLESLDAGRSWTPLGALPTNDLLSLAIDPYNPNYLIAGGYHGLLTYSPDGGMNWTAVPGIQGSVSALVFDPVNPGHLWAAINGRLRLSVDSGLYWRSASTRLDNRSVISLVFGPNSNAGPTGLTSEGYLFEQKQ